MSITVIADMKAKRGQVDALREMLSSHLPDTRARPGCESVMERFVALLDGPGPIRYLDFLGG